MAKTYADIPEPVLDFLSHPDAVRFLKKWEERHALPKLSGVLKLLDRVVLGEVALDALPSELVKLGVPEAKSKAAAVDLAADRLLPIAGAVGDVAGAIASWGGDLSKMEGGKTVDMPKVTAESFVAGYLAEHMVRMPTDVLQNRLVLLVTSFVKGVRDENEAANMMSRASKVGGLDMPEADARELLKGVAERLAFVKISFADTPKTVQAPAVSPEGPQAPLLGKEGAGTVRSETSPVPTAGTSAGTDLPMPLLRKEGVARQPLAGRAVDVPTDEDAAEVAALTKKKGIKPSYPSPYEGEGMGEVPRGSFADQVAQAAGLSFANADMKKRFELAVDARVRDVRDAFETRETLEAAVDKGGVGIQGAALATTVETLEKLVAQRRSSTDATAASAQKEFVSRTQEEKRSKDEARRAFEEAALSKRYAELTGRPTDAVSAAPIGAMKAAATARVSAATIPPGAGRPRVDDVRAARRLAGPVDELRGMTLAEFRRLSKDPEEAARKVKAKVALLEDQGYDQRIAAIKGWRESAVHRLYVALSQEALSSGKSVVQVAEERRKADPAMLTASELASLIKLNGELRF
ncbi:hypothetical protein EPO34_02470 [Patescibacteria group bacterium]|nr:MAG: hypothetical protein EPO34_02470 [Patescibacteria group bacterium]